MEIFKEATAKLGVRTEVCSNRSATIEGCDGIMDYSDDKVIIKSGRLKISVLGRDLRLTVLTNSSAVIEGTIADVNFSY